MRKLLYITACLAFCLHLSAHAAFAGGTLPGTVLQFQAELTYTLASQPSVSFLQTTSTTQIVDELINVSTVWQDAAPKAVGPGESNAVTTFKVTNLGNGSEAFMLTANPVVPGDNFDPAFASIYLDADNNGKFDAGSDTLYTSGANDPILATDAAITVFVLCNIPASVVDGNLGFVALTATSKTSGAAADPGTVFAAKGDGGVDAVIGNTRGSAEDTGKYQALAAAVKVNKTVAIVSDPAGNNPPLPLTGSVLRYTLTVTVEGGGTALGVVISDPVPANTTFYPGTLKLNGVVLTDGKDLDSGDVGLTTAGTITVSLGDLTSADQNTIMFDVTIN
jgi:uncharacterized repeat protein (TIGR01451 family)